MLSSRVKTAIALGVALAACLFFGPSATLLPASAAEEPERSNIVFILTDDADRLTQERAMPNARTMVRDAGVSFERATYAQPLCCPSRVSIMRGQYPHNTGVTYNVGENGGFAAFFARGLGDSMFASWLDGEGYQTGHFGKFLNGYKDASYVPNGWDRWYVQVSRPKWPFSSDGEWVRTSGLFDDAVAGEGLAFLRGSLAGDAPVIAQFSFKAPHQPAEYPEEMRKTHYANAKLPKPPSFN